MRNQLMPHWALPQNWLRFLVILLLVVGVFFRFVNLDRKVYSHDEAYTSLRISGYRMAEMVQEVFDGRLISIKDLQKYQHINSEKTLNDTIKSLAIEDPQHAPLYYVMLRYWMQIWVNLETGLNFSIQATRSFSAFISLLVFPCVYWLCWELFGMHLIGWMACVLIAVSPFHVLYAQEAREYVLWTVTILLSSAALLRAVRVRTKLSWGIYTAALALSFYSFSLTGLVAIGQGIYIFLNKPFREGKRALSFLLALAVSIVAFSPWIFIMFYNFHQVEATLEWTNNKSSIRDLMVIMGLHFIRIFWDLNSLLDNPFIYSVSLLFVILVIYSLYFIYFNKSPLTWLFLFTLVGVTVLVLLLPDLVIGGRRSVSGRYLIPCYLGVELSVAYLLTNQLFFSPSFSKRQFWTVITLILISAGVISCTIMAQSKSWWNKVLSYNNYEIAELVNKAERPLLISEKNSFGTNQGNILALSYLLNSKVKFQLVVEPNTPKIPDGFTDVFLLNPSNTLLKNFKEKAQFKLDRAYEVKRTYRQSGIILYKLIP